MKIGDKVKIVNTGQVCTTATREFEKLGFRNKKINDFPANSAGVDQDQSKLEFTVFGTINNYVAIENRNGIQLLFVKNGLKLVEEQPIFKVGDTVYNGQAKGRVTETASTAYRNYPTTIKFEGGPDVSCYTKEGNSVIGGPKVLSFTPYKPIYGDDFTQERPQAEIPIGKIVYCWDGEADDEDMEIRVARYNSPKCGGGHNVTHYGGEDENFDYVSTENPYDKK